MHYKKTAQRLYRTNVWTIAKTGHLKCNRLEVYQYRNSLILKHKLLYYCTGTFCYRREWKDSHRGMKIRNRLLLYSFHLPFMLHSHPHFSQLRACRRKAQIAASNKQNLKMKPADAQRLPCHKMRKKKHFSFNSRWCLFSVAAALL